MARSPRSPRTLRRSLVAWLTLLAMSLAFLAPALSRTLAVDAGNGFVPCPWHVGMAQPQQTDGTVLASTIAGDACPLCALAVALPPSATALVPLPSTAPAPMRPDLLAAPAWPTPRLAQPRGPPAWA